MRPTQGARRPGGGNPSHESVQLLAGDVSRAYASVRSWQSSSVWCDHGEALPDEAVKPGARMGASRAANRTRWYRSVATRAGCLDEWFCDPVKRENQCADSYVDKIMQECWSFDPPNGAGAPWRARTRPTSPQPIPSCDGWDCGARLGGESMGGT